MPTLKEIEQGLRDRLAELSRVRDAEAEQRAAAKAKVERVAQDAASNNSIGSAADDLLEELGLHGRPLHVTVYVDIEHKQTVPAGSARDVRVSDGNQLWAAYQNVSEVSIYTTSRIGISVPIPRNPDERTGCGCSVPITDDWIEAQTGRPPGSVERVDVTVVQCSMNQYPYTQSAETPCACLTMRRTREIQIAEAHDSPLVQQCQHDHRYQQPHRHIFYPNGDITYTSQQNYVPPDFATMTPGWYGTDGQVGQPVPGTPEPEPPNEHTVQVCTQGHPERVHWHFHDTTDVSRRAYDEVGAEPDGWTKEPGVFGPTAGELVQNCTHAGHPLTVIHAHFQREGEDHVTYSRDVNFTNTSATRVPGVFCRSVDVIGTVMPTE